MLLRRNIDVLYKDLKGGLSLYRVVEVKDKDTFSIKQNAEYCRDRLKFPKSFVASWHHKNGKQRIFPLWLEFGNLYIYRKNGQDKLVRFISYIYHNDAIHFDFTDIKVGTLYTLTFKESCEQIKFNIDGRE